jgi:hypothetical protein
MLKFASKKDALQHLSDITGKIIKIARIESEIYDYMDDKISFVLSFSTELEKNPINVKDIEEETQYLMNESKRQYANAIKSLETENIEFELLEDEVLFFIESKGNKLILSTDSGFGFGFTSNEDMESAKEDLKSL